jgi:hypothetical protein
MSGGRKYAGKYGGTSIMEKTCNLCGIAIMLAIMALI